MQVCSLLKRTVDIGEQLAVSASNREGNGNPSSILAWRIPWTEELVGYSPWDGKESDTTEQAGKFTLTQVSIPDP